jgi:DNA repair protein RadC
MNGAVARYTIKEWPSEERPRERLETLGPRALSPRELLALLIGTGTPGEGAAPPRSALDLAGDLLQRFAPPGGGGEGALRRMTQAPLAELCRVPGIGPAKAAKVLAALDLGRRAAAEALPDRDRVRTPYDVFERMQGAMRDLPVEEFHVLSLNSRNEILRDHFVSRGTVDASLVHPREVFRPALLEGATAVVLVHNHPSGDPSPSAADRETTRILRRAGHHLGIEVLDHVVIGDGRYVSFQETGLWDA